ncbi:MAG: alanyl-tRNA synthetase [Candidatus Promineifilaceae bacterium]
MGLIKVTRLERRKKMLRVEFLCGNRAIANYGRKTDILDDLIRQLSTGADSLLGSVEKLQKEMKALEREVRNLRKEQLAIVASQIEDKFEQVNDTHILTHVFSNGESLDSLRQIANILTLSENRIVLLGSSGDQAMLLFRSSAEEKYHMGNLLRTVLDAIGSKSGGGQQSLAQGGGQPASDQEISVALDDAKGRVAKQFFV